MGKTKEYLNSLYILDRKIEHLKRELQDVNAVKYSVPAIDTSKEAVQHSTSGTASYVAVVERADLILDRILKSLEEYIVLKHTIVDQIHNINNVFYIDLLYKRYVEYKPLKIIAEEMNYSYDYIRDRHGVALLAFASANNMN